MRGFRPMSPVRPNAPNNFANTASSTCRALARRSFIQFLQDPTPVFDVTKAEASKLLSGIAFLNISQLHDSHNQNRWLRLYSNPNATHPIPELAVDLLGWSRQIRLR
jgi:hypothetical protein